MRRACAADVLVGGAAAVLLLADVHLYRREKRLITDTLRTRPANPFRAAARLITRSDARA